MGNSDVIINSLLGAKTATENTHWLDDIDVISNTHNRNKYQLPTKCMTQCAPRLDTTSRTWDSAHNHQVTEKLTHPTPHTHLIWVPGLHIIIPTHPIFFFFSLYISHFHISINLPCSALNSHQWNENQGPADGTNRPFPKGGQPTTYGESPRGPLRIRKPSPPTIVATWSNNHAWYWSLPHVAPPLSPTPPYRLVHTLKPPTNCPYTCSLSSLLNYINVSNHV